MREATLLLAAILVGSAAVPSTTEPSWAPTGRLSQFKGFITPRPEQLDDGRQMYASIWATWSAWSFCSNGVRMRVRACNTVRGFSCLGPNQETRPCDAILPPPGHEKKSPTDYDIVDPWEDDRREAMKQLYPDDQAAPPVDTNFVQLSPFRPTNLRRAPVPQPPRPGVVDHSLIGFEDHRPANEIDGSPGSDPEKVFGARQFAVKSVTPDEMKELGQKEAEFDVNRLVPMGSVTSEEKPPQEKPVEDDKTFEDITFELAPPETTATTPTTPATTTTFSTTLSTTSTVKPLRQKFRSSGITGQRESKDEKIGDDLEEELARAFAMEKVDEMEEKVDEKQEEKQEENQEEKSEERAEEKLEMKMEEKEREVVDKSFEKAEVFGGSAVRVVPKLPPSAVDDNLEDLLEVADPLEEHMASLPERPTTEEPVMEHEAVQFRERQPTIFAVTETDRINSLMAQADKFRQQMKLGSSPKGSHKKKKYGITGFAFKKVSEDRPVQKLHDGEVGRAQFSANIAPVIEEVETLPPVTTTTTPTTPPPVSHPADDMPEISTDTLNALDWMLKNMTQAASKEDTNFLHQFTEVAVGPKVTEIKPSFPIQPTEPMEALPLPMKPRKRKLKKNKKKKGMKAEITKLHSGEWAPRNLDKSKMFPKFKARPMKIMRTRALGVRTINSDKDRIELPTKEALMGNMDNPDQIFEEVKQLQAEMNQIERQLETLGSQERQEILEADTLAAPLFVDGSRFDLFAPPSTETASLLQPTTPEPLRTLAPHSSPDKKWSDWSEWGLCFCGKQLRTRRCLYAPGCRGVSYETRLCSGGECASKRDETTPRARAVTLEYNGGPLRPRNRQP